MRKLKGFSSFLGFMTLTACVTINVYFPAAAAESAADKLIKEVYGIEGEAQPAEETATPPESGSIEQHDKYLFMALLDFMVPVAMAQQADINISTPGINKLKSVMKKRHGQLTPFYASGAVGMDSNGLIGIRDLKAVDLKQRNKVKKLVSNENRDRAALYKEIAKANGHAEWEGDIRKTFARRWIANAPGGWFYQSGGNWIKK